MENVIKWILTRIKEPSTLRGVIGLIAVILFILYPSSSSEIFAGAGAGIALIETIRSENKNDNEPTS